MHDCCSMNDCLTWLHQAAMCTNPTQPSSAQYFSCSCLNPHSCGHEVCGAHTGEDALSGRVQLKAKAVSRPKLSDVQGAFAQVDMNKGS